MPMDWSDKEDAIRDWVVVGSGLADTRVIWASQDGFRPQRPFATVTISSIDDVGAVDGQHTEYDPLRPAGQEIELYTKGLRDISVRVQFFTTSSIGDSCARALAHRTKLYLRADTVRDALRAAGLSPYDPGQVRDLSALLGSEFEGRASLDIRLYATDGISEFTTFIESVEAEIPALNDDTETIETP